ncbi:MAG TPA: LytTR family DNA-binding domain-containing protein [Chitinophagaceae bacterium]|nr:LytTR family DNA-binding domain-containing protein [Chitinophagaceae bacterium]
MKIKCLLVDDEPIAVEIIRSYMRNIDEVEIVAEFNNALDAYNFLQKEKVDLLLLDIKMPQLSGLDLLKTLDSRPLIILITAYSEFALEGYELDVVDYLIKPVSYQRFLKAISKVFNRLNVPANNTQPQAEKANASYIYFKQGKKMMKLLLSDILYFKGYGNYVKVFTEQKEIITYQTLNMLEKQLSTEGFIRVHKSFLVSLDKIDAFTVDTVEIKKKEIPIGNSYRQAVVKIFGKRRDVSI